MEGFSVKIDELLAFVDLNGIEAMNSDQVSDLVECVEECHKYANNGEQLVADGVYDKLLSILQRVAPDSEAAREIWSEVTCDDFTDYDALFRQHPMYSIMTCKSKDCVEFTNFLDRLPTGRAIPFHASLKLNGHGIRIMYADGEFVNARSRARASAGRDITKQLGVVLEQQGLAHIPMLEGVDLCEIRGELVLPLANLEAARKFNPSIKSAFTGVSSMLRGSATEEEWGLLYFVAYECLVEGNEFDSKTQEYEYLEELGFTTPDFLTLECTSEDMEADVDGLLTDMDVNFDKVYFTDGVVLTVDDTALFRSLGDDGHHYKYGNVALKFGKWEQDTYDGYVQCILYTQGKTKLSPVAVVAAKPDMIDLGDWESPFIYSQSVVQNWDALGVSTVSGNRVRKVPLYEPANILALNALPGYPLSFKYGGEAGVVPCYPDGTPLLDGRAKQILEGEVYNDED